MIQIHTVTKNTPLGNEKMKIDTFPIIDFLFTSISSENKYNWTLLGIDDVLICFWFVGKLRKKEKD